MPTADCGIRTGRGLRKRIRIYRHLGRNDTGAFFRGNLIEHMDIKCYTNSDKKRRLFFILA